MDTKDKKRFSVYLEKTTKILQKKVLDISELVVPQSTYPQFRSKILGMINDFRRELERELELNYSLKFDPKTSCEDIVEVVPYSKQETNTKVRR